MVTVAYHPHFEKTIRKIKDAGLKGRLKQQILRIIENPDVGKPMRYARKETREVYIPLFRLFISTIGSGIRPSSWHSTIKTSSNNSRAQSYTSR